MKHLITLLFILTSILLTNCQKDKEEQFHQQQITMLQSHRWMLDSIVTTYRGTDTIQALSPLDSTWLEFNLSSYFEYTYKTGTLTHTQQAYELTTNESRIYYWDITSTKNKEVYHNIQLFTDERLVYTDYNIATSGETTVKTYYYRAR